MEGIKELLMVIGSDDASHRLDEEQRNRLIAELEACLVDEERLECYLEILKDVCGGKPRYADRGFAENEEQFDAVCKDGLQALDNESLVRTALNPGVLWAMADLLCDVNFMCEDTFTKHWSTVLAECGRELLRQDRLRSESLRLQAGGSGDESTRIDSEFDEEEPGTPPSIDRHDRIVDEIAYWSQLLHPENYVNREVLTEHEHPTGFAAVVSRPATTQSSVHFFPVFQKLLEEYRFRQASYATAAARPAETLTEARADLARQRFLIEGDEDTHVELDLRIPPGEVWVCLAQPSEKRGEYAQFELTILGLTSPIVGDLKGAVGKATLTPTELELLSVQRGTIGVRLVTKNGLRRDIRLGSEP